VKNRITIRMGASRFDAVINLGDRIMVYDLKNLSKKQEKDFRVELVAQFREAGLQIN
jgi:hypothetical protein